MATLQLPSDTTYVVAHNSFHGYYHWLLESIPKLILAQETLSNFTLLLPTTYVEPFYKFTLDALGINDVHYIERGRRICAHISSALHVRANGQFLSWNSPTRSRGLIQAGKIRQRTEPAWRKLYVSRRKANRRHVLNESELQSALESIGFQTVCFEEITLREQIKICSSADIMVGIHGAGLANMLFMRNGAHVVELRKFDLGENFFFERLSSTLGHNYHLLHCAADDEASSVQDANCYVDIPALLALLGREQSGL